MRQSSTHESATAGNQRQECPRGCRQPTTAGSDGSQHTRRSAYLWLLFKVVEVGQTLAKCGMVTRRACLQEGEGGRGCAKGKGYLNAATWHALTSDLTC